MKKLVLTLGVLFSLGLTSAAAYSADSQNIDVGEAVAWKLASQQLDGAYLQCTYEQYQLSDNKVVQTYSIQLLSGTVVGCPDRL
ncbi:hypothetical protein RHO15_08935 [Utexia brackfieldae]|uniref:hypothetical protein n=1 Tax=Utexia brackfieldae TaxID=3074108 RepID=UPI00370D5FDF